MNKKILSAILAALMLFSLSACKEDEHTHDDENDISQIEIPAVSGDDTKGDDSSDSELELEAAPDFTVYDADGNPHKLSDLKGKPVVLNFWASWCGPCKSEMPDFNETFKEYDGKVEFMMVNLTDGEVETVESARNFIHMMEYTFPVYYDTDIDAAGKYGITSIPTTFFIDADGNLVAHATGAIDKDLLLRGIGMIYAEVQ